MLLGMTRGEAGLVLFIFALVYFAQIVPRIGAFLGALGAKLTGPRSGKGGGLGSG